MIAWFEIPVNDMDRAAAFYRKVLEVPVEIKDINGLEMGWILSDHESGRPLGALIRHESYVPGEQGVLIYLSTSDIEKALSRVERAGGKIYMPKTMISDAYGFMGVFIDTEGNRIAFHATA